MSAKVNKDIKIGQVWMHHLDYKDCEKYPYKIKSTSRYKISKITKKSDGYKVYQFNNILDTSGSIREWDDSNKKNSLEYILNKYYVLVEKPEGIKIKCKNLNI